MIGIEEHTIEELFTKEHLVTLKARSNLGVLPEIDAAKIPEAGRKLVLQTAERLQQSSSREESRIPPKRMLNSRCSAPAPSFASVDGEQHEIRLPRRYK